MEPTTERSESQLLEEANRDRPLREFDPEVREKWTRIVLSDIPQRARADAAWLIARFPHTFAPEPTRVRPLKIGIDRDIVEVAASEGRAISPDVLGAILRKWTGRKAYRLALRAGRRRRDLKGLRCALVRPEEREMAAKTIAGIETQRKLTTEAALAAGEVLQRARDALTGAATASPADIQAARDAAMKSLRALTITHPLVPELRAVAIELAALWRRKQRDRQLEHGKLFVTAARTVLTAEQFHAIAARTVTDAARTAQLEQDFANAANARDAAEIYLLARGLPDNERRGYVDECATQAERMRAARAELESAPFVFAFRRVADASIDAETGKRIHRELARLVDSSEQG